MRCQGCPRAEAGQHRKGDRNGAARDAQQRLRLLAQAPAHDVARGPAVLQVPQQDGQRPEHRSGGNERSPGVAPGHAPQREPCEGHARIGQRDRLLPEGGAQQHADREVRPPGGAAARVRRQHPRDQRQCRTSKREHVDVLADAVERERGQELRAERQVEARA
jgi:hypothetical protein